MNCGEWCARALLIIFNIIFWLTGAALLAVGLWLRLDTNALQVIDVAQSASQDKSFEIACYVLIGVGALVFVIGFLGCCGALKRSRCMLSVYIFCLVLVFCIELAAGILALVYKDMIMKDLKMNLVTELNETQYYDQDYNPTLWGTTMNVVQHLFQCCGMENYTDYRNGVFLNVSFNPQMIPYPYACCDLKTDDPDNAKEDDVENWPGCQNTPDYRVGCYHAIAEWLEKHSAILIGVGIGIACIQIFGFIFAICLCRSIPDD